MYRERGTFLLTRSVNNRQLGLTVLRDFEVYPLTAD